MAYIHGKSIIKIALADDDLLIQDLLPGFIDGIENCKVVIKAYNGRELLEKLSQKPNTNLVIMDIRMPEMDGIEAAKKIKGDFPKMKILFSSVYHNGLAYYRVVDAGADGFVEKGMGVSAYKSAIYEVMKNDWYFPHGVAAIIRRGRNDKSPHLDSRIHISEEELVFLKFACTDKTYDAIASDMRISTRHVDYIRQSLFEKFEVHNRVELALFACKGGI